MPYILLPMKLSSTLWEVIKQVYTIHLLLVGFSEFPGPCELADVSQQRVELAQQLLAMHS
jgi:hypothetical protein